MEFLTDPGDDREVLREVCGEDPGDPVCVEILQRSSILTARNHFRCFCQKYLNFIFSKFFLFKINKLVQVMCRVTHKGYDFSDDKKLV